MRYFIHTYGCQMNSHESEKIVSQFNAAGFVMADKQETADIIVFNTCCIRNTAEQKIISHIGDTKHLGKNVIVCVVGCLSQRDAGKLKDKFQHIKVILGTHNIGKLLESVMRFVQEQKSIVEVIEQREEVEVDWSAEQTDKRFDIDVSAIKQREVEGRIVKYVNITYGCENYCSYCIVPYVRGKLISRDSAIVEKEFRRVAKDGTLVYLLGQNVNSYVCPKTGIGFAELVDKLCQIEGEYLVNFMSSHPKDFSEELVRVIARNERVERNIHLPVQSGCDRILKLMNRGYTTAEYKAKIDFLRKSISYVRITTDIICGFPTETEEEHRETYRFMQEIGFNSAFIFPYSKRTGTVADKMDGQIDSKTKKRRTTELVKLMREMTTGANKNKGAK